MKYPSWMLRSLTATATPPTWVPARVTRGARGCIIALATFFLWCVTSSISVYLPAIIVGLIFVLGAARRRSTRLFGTRLSSLYSLRFLVSRRLLPSMRRQMWASASLFGTLALIRARGAFPAGGRFVRMMETREQYCRSKAARLSDRAHVTAGKVERTKRSPE